MRLWLVLSSLETIRHAQGARSDAGRRLSMPTLVSSAKTRLFSYKSKTAWKLPEHASKRVAANSVVQPGGQLCPKICVFKAETVKAILCECASWVLHPQGSEGLRTYHHEL